MAFYGYKGDVDNCYWTPYNSSNFDSTPLQYETPFPDYNSSNFDSTPLQYETPFLGYNSSSSPSFYSSQELNYSVHTYTDPQTHYYYNYNNYYTQNPLTILQSEPISYTFSSPTEFKISYSVSQHNDDTDFDEYDPTPYGGGYDPDATYGKPLPPSDKICYPKTVAKTDGVRDFSYNSAVLKEDLGENQPKTSIEVIKPVVEEKPDAKTDNVGKVNDNEALALIPVDEIDKSKSFEHENDTEKNQMYGYGQGSDFGNVSYGSGLEAMDICETIFGYWPCVAKLEKREMDKLREINEQERRDDSWNVAADYLFGTPNVYTYESYYR